MKRLIVCLAFITISATVAQAQLVRGAGLKAGATFSKQEWDYDTSTGESEKYDRTGLNLGGFIEFFNNPILSLVTEVNYIQKGAEGDILIALPGSPAEKSHRDNRIDYLNFAALAKARINLGIIQPYVLAGPKIDFEVKKTKSPPNSSFNDDFKKGRWGFKVGFGSEINILPINLLAEVLYDADFDELYDDQNLKIKTNSVDLRVGILF